MQKCVFLLNPKIWRFETLHINLRKRNVRETALKSLCKKLNSRLNFVAKSEPWKNKCLEIFARRFRASRKFALVKSETCFRRRTYLFRILHTHGIESFYFISLDARVQFTKELLKSACRWNLPSPQENKDRQFCTREISKIGHFEDLISECWNVKIIG